MALPSRSARPAGTRRTTAEIPRRPPGKVTSPTTVEVSGVGGLGRWSLLAVAVVAAVGLAGCGVPLAGASRPLAALPGRPAPHPSHIIVVIEENHSFEQIIGSPAAPFINRLAADGTLLTSYHAITHPSLPNYIALLSGHIGPIRSDCHRCTITGPTLVDQLEARHISWAAYFEGLPRPCSRVTGSGAYTEAVDPFMHAATIRDASARCDRVRPFRSFGADLAAGRLPSVAFVAPDLLNDMHSGPVQVADGWLGRLVGELEANRVWRQDTRVVVTFDEGARSDTRSCCRGFGRGGLIPTIVAGPRVPRGRDPTPYTHYALLRSIEAAFGLPFLGHAGDPSTATVPAVAGGAGAGATSPDA
jgi:phosphatidylinositol-3-phosphatase